jgi:hypothetical protein
MLATYAVATVEFAELKHGRINRRLVVPGLTRDPWVERSCFAATMGPG